MSSPLPFYMFGINSKSHPPCQAKSSGKFLEEELLILRREFQHHKDKIHEYNIVMDTVSRTEGEHPGAAPRGSPYLSPLPVAPPCSPSTSSQRVHLEPVHLKNKASYSLSPHHQCILRTGPLESVSLITSASYNRPSKSLSLPSLTSPMERLKGPANLSPTAARGK